MSVTNHIVLREWNTLMYDINTTVNRNVLNFLMTANVQTLWKVGGYVPSNGKRHRDIGVNMWSTEKRVLAVWNYNKNGVVGLEYFPSVNVRDFADPHFL
jgi:hypothetical protein